MREEKMTQGWTLTLATYSTYTNVHTLCAHIYFYCYNCRLSFIHYYYYYHKHYLRICTEDPRSQETQAVQVVLRYLGKSTPHPAIINTRGEYDYEGMYATLVRACIDARANCDPGVGLGTAPCTLLPCLGWEEANTLLENFGDRYGIPPLHRHIIILSALVDDVPTKYNDPAHAISLRRVLSAVVRSIRSVGGDSPTAMSAHLLERKARAESEERARGNHGNGERYRGYGHVNATRLGSPSRGSRDPFRTPDRTLRSRARSQSPTRVLDMDSAADENGNEPIGQYATATGGRMTLTPGRLGDNAPASASLSPSLMTPEPTDTDAYITLALPRQHAQQLNMALSMLWAHVEEKITGYRMFFGNNEVCQNNNKVTL